MAMTAGRSRSASLDANDPLLHRLLTCAEDERAAEEAIVDLVKRAADVIDDVLGYYRRRGMLDWEECDFVASTVRLRLLVKLRQLTGSDDAIESYEGYVAGLAYNAVCDTFRRRFPERAQLKKRLVDAAARDGRIVVESIAGDAVWRLKNHGGTPGVVAIDDVERTAPLLDRDAPAEAIEIVLRRAGGSARMTEVVAALLAAWSVPATRPADLAAIPDPEVAPPVRLELREELDMLWSEVRLLPPPQRAALLLNLRAGDCGDVASLLILTGVTSFTELAATIGIPPAELESLWSELPLDDATIAHRLAATRQQVINFRKSARERLRRRMQAWRDRGSRS
jgi:hypothetical protein